MHQYWFINCVKVPQKHTMLITGETVRVWHIGTLLSYQFFYKPKAVQKPKCIGCWSGLTDIPFKNENKIPTRT